jgi:hypothetical protein
VRLCRGFAETEKWATKNNRDNMGGLELGMRIPQSFCSEIVFRENSGLFVEKKEEIDQFEAEFGPAILFLRMGRCGGGGGGGGDLKEIFLRILFLKRFWGSGMGPRGGMLGPIWNKICTYNWWVFFCFLV